MKIIIADYEKKRIYPDRLNSIVNRLIELNTKIIKRASKKDVVTIQLAIGLIKEISASEFIFDEEYKNVSLSPIQE